MTNNQRRFALIAGLAVVLLSVAGVAYMLDLCAPLTDFGERVPLGFNIPPLLAREPEALAAYASERVARQLGSRGTVEYGPTQALYDCSADGGCALARYHISVAVEPHCPFNRRQDRRALVSYTFDYRLNVLAVERHDAPWNGGLDLAALPMSFDRAADLIHASVDPAFVAEYPDYSIDLMPMGGGWSVQVMADGGSVLHLYAINAEGAVRQVA